MLRSQCNIWKCLEKTLGIEKLHIPRLKESILNQKSKS